MCTFSFVPDKDGYVVAMNRDEQRSRVRGLPPELVRAGELLAVYPHEPEGGSWIAANERGITLSMLNWNLPGGSAGEKRNSRGSIIPRLISCGDLTTLAREMSALALRGTLPFRLLGICWPERQVCEFRWDGSSLQTLEFPWQARHWFSSGISDEEAQRERGEACRVAWQQPEAGSLTWLRALHASHSTGDAFSPCVHRADAETVSYSEIECRAPEMRFRYVNGAPCRHTESAVTLQLPLSSGQHPVIA